MMIFFRPKILIPWPCVLSIPIMVAPLPSSVTLSESIVIPSGIKYTLGSSCVSLLIVSLSIYWLIVLHVSQACYTLGIQLNTQSNRGINMTNFLIRNGTLIDGTGHTPLADAAVLVRENRIDSVGHANSVRLPDAQVTEIDAGGGYILPGLIDTHVHVMLEGVNIARDIVTPFSMRFFNAVNYLKSTIDAGITSVRDAGGADAGVKQAVESGVILGPR